MISTMAANNTRNDCVAEFLRAQDNDDIIINTLLISWMGFDSMKSFADTFFDTFDSSVMHTKVKQSGNDRIMKKRDLLAMRNALNIVRSAEMLEYMSILTRNGN